MVPELHRPFSIGRIGAGTRFLVEAGDGELQALAARMGLHAILRLTCRFDLRRGEADSVEAAGLLQARVRQSCVVSLEEFDADVVDSFSVRFVPENLQSEVVDVESDDEIVYQGGVIDLGEAASEQLALSLDPFPRKPGAELPWDVAAQEEGPFASLSKLLPPH